MNRAKDILSLALLSLRDAGQLTQKDVVDINLDIDSRIKNNEKN